MINMATSEEDFLNIKIEKKENSIPTGPRIIERTIHTIQTLKVYPNGEIFITKSVSWLDKKGMVVKPKHKKKLSNYKKEEGIVEL